MISARAEEVKESVRQALTEALRALENAQTDEDVALVIGVVEGLSNQGLSRRLRPLENVEETLRRSTMRLERISRPGTPVK